MKKVSLAVLLIAFLFPFIVVSQNLVLTFTGQEEGASSHVSIDSIFIRNVTSGGDTTVASVECSLDMPVGYTLNLSETCYDIQTSAGFDGKLTICITFDLTSIPVPPGISGLVMLRCDPNGENCEPLTNIESLVIDNEAGIGTLCVFTDHLSIFTLVGELKSTVNCISSSTIPTSLNTHLTG